MARNVELKARDPDPARSLQASLDLGAVDQGLLQQLDTYFKVPNGRLKLREQQSSAELIFYERTNQAIERESNYQIITVAEPEALKHALSAALGVLVAVEKSRRLLLWRNVRIHLDEVPGLGNFIELEAVAPPESDLALEYHLVARLRQTLGISYERVLAVSYSDQLLAAGV